MDDGILFLRSECVSDQGLDLAQAMFISEAANSVLKRSECGDGDILLTITGNVGRVIRLRGVERANINQHIARIRIVSSAADPDYVFQSLSQLASRKRFEAIVTGQAYPQISLRQVRSAEVAVPSTRREQAAIAAALSDADSLIESLTLLLAKKRHIKKGAMQQLLTGKRRLRPFTGAWKTTPLEELFTFSGGLSASRDELSTDGYCYLHYGDIHTSESLFVDVKNAYRDIPKLKISLGEVPRASLLADGDVVFVDASEDEDGASRYVVVSNPEGIPFISGLHTIVAKPKNDRVDRLFRRYCFQSAAVKAQFHFFAVGTKVLGVSKANIKKIELCLPSVPEQAAIAAILTEMDAEIEALQQKVDKARQLKQGMMQELLTGQIRLVDAKTADDLQLVQSA
jgi:type I restriction enzyme S subunit